MVWLFWSKKKGTHHTSTLRLIPVIVFIKDISKPKWKQRVTYCDTSAPRPCFFSFFFVTCVSSCKSPFITNFENTPHTTQAQRITVSSPAVRRHTECSHQGSALQGRGHYTQRQNRMQMPNRRNMEFEITPEADSSKSRSLSDKSGTNSAAWLAMRRPRSGLPVGSSRTLCLIQWK